MSQLTHTTILSEVSSLSIDIFICCASYEERCAVIHNLVKEKINKETLIYCHSNEGEAILKAAMHLKATSNVDSDIIELNTNFPVQNFMEMSRSISAMLERNDSPNILLDITTFTHESLLMLVRILELNKDKIGKIVTCYSGAGEYSTNEPDDKKKWLSKGIKEIRTIIGYPGYSDPLEKNHLMILFGFELDRTVQLIKEYEYHYITLGFADVNNSIQSNHNKINLERHNRLLEDYPNAYQFNFSLVDPFNTKSEILNYLGKERFINMNTVIAPFNNKISTIGAGLAAMENIDIQLAYAQPMLYNTTGYSTPNEKIYLNDLEL